MGSGGSVPLSNRQANLRDSGAIRRVDEIQDNCLSQGLQTKGPIDSQGPSPYATLRRDDWWQQRPSAPSLPGSSSIRGSFGQFEANAPHHETLLAHASQMTGWQSGGDSNHDSARSEVSELSRTVSCLAAANQQLAAAHGAALAHLEALYLDLKSARLSGDNFVKDDEKDIVLRRETHRGDDENQEKVRNQLYVTRLESLLAARTPNSRDQDPRRMSRWSNDSNLQERLSSTLENDVDQEQELRLFGLQNETEDRGKDEENNTTGRENVNQLNDALPRIEELENSLRCERLKNVTDETAEQFSNIHQYLMHEKGVQCDDIRDSEISEETLLLNETLRSEIEIQKQTIQRLKEERQISNIRGERAESELRDCKEEVARLATELEISNTKRDEMLSEANSFRAERDDALVRISGLELDLQKSVADKELIKNIESQKSAKLRAQLAEEIGDKKKQIKALEDALEEIQRLKLAVKTEKRDSASTEDDAEVQKETNNDEATTSLENVFESTEEMPEDIAGNRAINMEEFKKELTLKREARQRAIAAVSSEMDRLRRELTAEKEAHSETSRILHILKSGHPEKTSETSVNENSAQSSISEELARLKNELHEEKKAHQETVRRTTAQQISDTLRVSDEIKNFVRSEAEKLEDLRYHLERDTDKHEKKISEIKEAVGTARLMLVTREKQVNKLKDQLAHILARLDGRNCSLVFDDTRAEFDHQLENLRNLKTLYEVRLKVLIELKEQACKELVETKEKLEISQKKLKTLEEDLEKADEKVDIQDTEISNLESQLGLTKADCRDLENQMSVINSLFTQMLLSASSADMDLDRLTRLLQENHDLISDMAREEGTEAAALPKLLLDLVEQVEGRSPAKPKTSGGEGEKNEEDIQEENIAHNLPKVWRVLLELLSCHAVEVPSTSATASSAPDSCYKSVDTPTGPQLVISVSKTYIRLKELILEKKQLEKEMTRMKQLNTHLESKLGEQEKRLSTVSSELSKTWNIVGRMQAQHQQLHTHEKILRYELQQKRKMLQELKQELEYCREKWESARQKNTNTELEWKSLRREFAARKALAVRDSLNNSGESGFSDERGDESDEEDVGRAERIRISPRRRTRKESPRVPTPDTESEQPTDTEMSESKTCSSDTLEQRTPTPETETEADPETIEDDSPPSEARPATPEPDCTPEAEILDPLDRALTNVIQSLIKIDTVSSPSSASTSRESIAFPQSSNCLPDSTTCKSTGSERLKTRSPSCRRNIREWSPNSEPWSSSKPDLKRTTLSAHKPSKPFGLKFGGSERSSFDFEDCEAATTALNVCSPSISTVKNKDTAEPGKKESENLAEIESTAISSVSVFSIGPYPASKSPSPVKSVQFRDPLILGPRSSLEPSTSNQSSCAIIQTSDVEAKTTTEKENEVFRGSSDDGSIISENGSARLNETSDLERSLNEQSVISSEPTIETSSPVTCSSYELINNVEIPDEVKEKDLSSKSAPSMTDPLLDEPSTSTSKSSAPSPSVPKTSRTPEEVLAARAARLKRLEEQADWLMKKMNATSQRGSALSTRLEELHEAYGEPPAPPPLPDVLPSVRLQTDRLEDEQTRTRADAPSSPSEILELSNSTNETHTDANESPPNNAP